VVKEGFRFGRRRNVLITRSDCLPGLFDT
jgi:hypothetical protein